MSNTTCLSERARFDHGLMCTSYLAVKSALMCEADYVFIREWPQKMSWPENLCKNVVTVRTKYPVSSLSGTGFICFTCAGQKTRKEIEHHNNLRRGSGRKRKCNYIGNGQRRSCRIAKTRHSDNRLGTRAKGRKSFGV